MHNLVVVTKILSLPWTILTLYNTYKRSILFTNLATIMTLFIPIYLIIWDRIYLLSKLKNKIGDRAMKLFSIQVWHRHICSSTVAPHFCYITDKKNGETNYMIILLFKFQGGLWSSNSVFSSISCFNFNFQGIVLHGSFFCTSWIINICIPGWKGKVSGKSQNSGGTGLHPSHSYTPSTYAQTY